MIDLLHAVDWVVDDPKDCAARVNTLLRLPPQPPAWTNEVPTHLYEAVFAKTSSELADAPTRLEFIRSWDPSPGVPVCSRPPLRIIEAAQNGRQQRTHATVFCVSDFDEYTEALRRAGTAVWLEPGCEHLPKPRGWVSWTSGTDRQNPATDAGLFLEYIPTSVLGPAVSASVDGTSTTSAPRVTRRTHLVQDLSGVVRTLERHAALMASGPITIDRSLSATVARYESRHPASAVLELVEPVGEGLAADYFAAWGPGPWFTGIALEDPAGVVSDALAAGATSVRAGDDAIVEIDPGMLFEISGLRP